MQLTRRKMLLGYGSALFGLLLSLFLPIAAAHAYHGTKDGSQEGQPLFVCGWILEAQSALGSGDVPENPKGVFDLVDKCEFCLTACDKTAPGAQAHQGAGELPDPARTPSGFEYQLFVPIVASRASPIRAPPAV